jgi:hypothetical protein
MRTRTWRCHSTIGVQSSRAHRRGAGENAGRALRPVPLAISRRSRLSSTTTAKRWERSDQPGKAGRVIRFNNAFVGLVPTGDSRISRSLSEAQAAFSRSGTDRRVERAIRTRLSATPALPIQFDRRLTAKSVVDAVRETLPDACSERDAAMCAVRRTRPARGRRAPTGRDGVRPNMR